MPRYDRYMDDVKIKPGENGSEYKFLFETIYYFCNISSCLLTRNKVKLFFKIKMDRALGKTPRFLSYPGACRA